MKQKYAIMFAVSLLSSAASAGTVFTVTGPDAQVAARQARAQAIQKAKQKNTCWKWQMPEQCPFDGTNYICQAEAANHGGSCSKHPYWFSPDPYYSGGVFMDIYPEPSLPTPKICEPDKPMCNP